MWALLDENWTKLEPILLESLIVLEGSIMALKLRESCAKLRVHLIQKKSVEQAFICYNVSALLVSGLGFGANMLLTFSAPDLPLYRN
jgi:hypothetical protein